MKDKIICIMLVCTLVVVGSSPAIFAKEKMAEVDPEILILRAEQIIDKIEELQQNIWELEELDLSSKYYDKQIKSLEKELCKYGARKISKREVSNLYGITFLEEQTVTDGGIANSMMSDPPQYNSTDNYNMYNLGPYTYGGITYSYLEVTPKTTTNNALWKSDCDVAVVGSNVGPALMSSTLSLASYLSSTYLLDSDLWSAVVGLLLPEIADAVADSLTTVTFDNEVSSWACSTRMKHCFIYDSSSDYWDYEGASARVIAMADTLYYVNEDGTPIRDRYDFDVYEYAEYYTTLKTKCNNTATFVKDDIYKIQYKKGTSTKSTIYCGFIEHIGHYD